MTPDLAKLTEWATKQCEAGCRVLVEDMAGPFAVDRASIRAELSKQHDTLEAAAMAADPARAPVSFGRVLLVTQDAAGGKLASDAPTLDPPWVVVEL